MRELIQVWCIALAAILISSSSLLATHNRAGEITYVQIDELTIECTVTTYTKESSVSADRDSLIIDWGDGSFSVVLRSNGPGNNGESLGNDIKRNIYIGRHTYPGRGTYVASVEDPNRIADIKNVPNSVNVRFFLFTRFTLLNSQFQGSNSSVVLLEPPIDVGCVGRAFVHNPSAFDPDGDSLSFSLVPPLQAKDSTIRGYLYPDQILPGPGNVINLNERTGEFSWLFPPVSGDYNIAIEIREYRDGQLINVMIRDMQIQILECDNQPPIITAEREICVVAGTEIVLPITATDGDVPADAVVLTASGGSFDLSSSPSVFEVSSNPEPSPNTGIFRWQTTCDHIRESAYLVVFKATDQPPVFPSLTDLHTLSIKVVGPSPENLEGGGEGDDIILNWDAPYLCENARDDYFYGFSIWRSRNSNQFLPDTCDPGLEGKGYEIIDFRSRNLVGSKYEYRDSTASKGITYCYRIQAEFAQTSSAGNPFNFVASLPSNEVCVQLSRDQPLLLNVDIEETDLLNGRIFIRWTKPLAEDLDTLARPGPYVYQLQRAVAGSGQFANVADARFVAPSFSSEIDTTYRDSLLNTNSISYDYRVDFTYGGLDNFRISESASSVFLSAGGSDRSAILEWEEEVPWTNTKYFVLRENASGTEDTIGTTSENQFIDRFLTNGQTYCYRILAEGTYGITNTPSLLLNHSQKACVVPFDSVPPCPPEISASNDCEDDKDSDEDEFFNVIQWNDPSVICEGSTDIVQFIVYYRLNDSSSWAAIDTVVYGQRFSTLHQPGTSSSGCYAVTSVDSVGNESRFSNISCVDNCPLYELPNVFTPNGDSQNDLFVPRKRRFIARVDFEVYNRWGQMVYATEDPDLLWNGENLNGQPLDAGTYFYKCVVFEQLTNGVVPQEEVLSGYIELNRAPR